MSTAAERRQALSPSTSTRSRRRLGVEPVSVLGRLYYHLDPIYAQEAVDGRGRKSFYTKRRSGRTARRSISRCSKPSSRGSGSSDDATSRERSGLRSSRLGSRSGALVVSIVTAATACGMPRKRWLGVAFLAGFDAVALVVAFGWPAGLLVVGAAL